MRFAGGFTAALTLVLAITGSAHAHEVLSSADLSLDAVARLRGHVTVGTDPSLPARRQIMPGRTGTRARSSVADDTTRPPGRFRLLGHSPLNHRGMNSALAVHNGYAYIGSRTDGTHLDAGVMVVDARDPRAPRVVGQIGPPYAAMPFESSRELRVLREQELLMVLSHGCSELIHRCANPSLTGRSLLRASVRFFDISGANAAAPKFVAEYTPPRSNSPQSPHEFFVWVDPEDPARVLMYATTPSSDTGTNAQLYVTDISRAGDGVFTELANWRTTIGNPDRDNRLHSLTVSDDGTRAYLAYLGGGFLVADTSDFATGATNPEVRLVTPVEDRVFWTNPGAHSAIKLPGRHYALTTDEVYGEIGGLFPDHGCPWGWLRFIDIEDESKPRVASEFRLSANDPAVCATVDPVRNNLASFASHNPTLTRHLAFVTWHSGGLQAVDISAPEQPRQAAEFMPRPLPFVQTEDPALSSGNDKVVMWSFPVIEDGLIYVVDLRNGLYILRYSGPHAHEVRATQFADGNTNQR